MDGVLRNVWPAQFFPWNAPAPRKRQLMRVDSIARQVTLVPKPEPHVHVAVHSRSGLHVHTSLLRVSDTVVKLGEARMAMGGERTHSALFGESEGSSVISFRGFGIELVRMALHVTEQA